MAISAKHSVGQFVENLRQGGEDGNLSVGDRAEMVSLALSWNTWGGEQR